MPVSMVHPGNPYKFLKRIFALCLFVCMACNSFAQDKTQDSLQTVIKTAAEDTNKVNALNALARITINEDFAKAKGLAQQALSLAKTLPAERSALKGIANAYHVLGIIAFFEDDFPGALKNYSESLAIRKKIGDRKGIAASQNNMALIYSDMGDYPGALKSHYASLKIEEEDGDKQAAGYPTTISATSTKHSKSTRKRSGILKKQLFWARKPAINRAWAMLTTTSASCLKNKGNTKKP